MDIGLT